VSSSDAKIPESQEDHTYKILLCLSSLPLMNDLPTNQPNLAKSDSKILLSSIQLILWRVLCRGAYRSEAAYMYSSDAKSTQGVGYVTSLSLILTFSESFLLPWTCT